MRKIGEKITFKLYKNKRWIAGVVAAATLVGFGYTFHIRRKNDFVRSHSDYTIGYEDIGRFNGITNRVMKGNFVLLDVGDHNSRGVFFQKEKMDYCVQKEIDLGLIVSSDAANLADIYWDLEYVMGILEEYSIRYPVYLKVDGILKQDHLTLENALELINAFLEKAEQNHIYVGLCGSYENLLDEFLEYDYLDLDGMDQEGTLFQKKDIYYADMDVKKEIEDNFYNEPSYFKEDGYHVCQEGESFREIANLYGLSVYDLKRYNSKFLNKVEMGDILRIPSWVQDVNSNVNFKDLKKGIDVSLWQGEIPWEEVSVEFAIIQVRDFINAENDPQFENNVGGCKRNGIPMGFYAFSRATTIEEVQEEAKYLVAQLEGIAVEYPVYLDLETEFWNSIDSYSSNFVKEFLQTWEREILMAGYIPGIYCSTSLYEKLNLLTDHYLEHLTCWIAGGSYYDQEVSYEEEVSISNDEGVSMRQISAMGKVDGISNYVDLNYCYGDYGIYYRWERKDFFKVGSKLEVGVPMIVIGGFAFKIGRKYHKKKIKKKMVIKQ